MRFVSKLEVDETCDADGMGVGSNDELEPELKVWCAVLSQAMKDSLRGDRAAQVWLSAVEGDVKLICQGLLNLNVAYTCGLMKRDRRSTRQRLLFGRDTRTAPKLAARVERLQTCQK
jgi:hypothetical protein